MQHRRAEGGSVAGGDVGEHAAVVFVARNAGQNHGSGADQPGEDRLCASGGYLLAGARAVPLRRIYAADANEGFDVLTKPHMDHNPQGIAIDHLKNAGADGPIEDFCRCGWAGKNRHQRGDDYCQRAKKGKGWPHPGHEELFHNYALDVPGMIPYVCP
jgi:hypothetical protein